MITNAGKPSRTPHPVGEGSPLPKTNGISNLYGYKPMKRHSLKPSPEGEGGPRHSILRAVDEE